MCESVPDLPTEGERAAVSGWCLTLQNHAATGYAPLFDGFEKTPVLCGFKGYAYEEICIHVKVK